MPMAVNVYSNKVLLAVWMEVPMAIIIENESVSKSFKSLFELLWKNAKK
jgi:hypothetical protein